MTHLEALTIWTDRFRNLKSWGRTLENVHVEYESYAGQAHVGLCWPVFQLVRIRYTDDMAHDLSTVLHELAHAATPAGEHHSEKWQMCYSRAVSEVSGVPTMIAAPEYRDVDIGVEFVMKHWWKISGERFKYELATGAYGKAARTR